LRVSALAGKPALSLHYFMTFSFLYTRVFRSNRNIEKHGFDHDRDAPRRDRAAPMRDRIGVNYFLTKIYKTLHMMPRRDEN
jgi:hypothetical protein